LMVTDMDAALGGGVALFGRMQLTRSRLLTLQRTEIEGLELFPVPVITALGSVTGAARSTQTELVISAQDAAYAETQSRLTAMNFDIAVEGGFQLTTFLLEAMNHGKR